jgi:hypothetical protein
MKMDMLEMKPTMKVVLPKPAYGAANKWSYG